MIFYCSLVFTSSTFYAIKTLKGYITCTPLEAIEFGVLNPDQAGNVISYWKGLVDKELSKMGYLAGDVIYYSIVVPKLTVQVANTIREACNAAAIEILRVAIEEESQVVVNYLKQTQVVGKDTLTLVTVSQNFVQVKTVHDGIELGKSHGTGVGISALDSLFLNFITHNYPQSRDLVSSSEQAKRDLIIAFKQLRHAFENGNQWTAGAYRIAVPQSLKHLFKDDSIEIKVQELRDIYEPVLQNILQVLASHINDGYTNDVRFESQPISLLYIGKQSAYITVRLDTFARVNNLGMIPWPCELEKMTMIGAATGLESRESKREGDLDMGNVPFKVPKLEEFFKSRNDDVVKPLPPPPEIAVNPPQPQQQQQVMMPRPNFGAGTVQSNPALQQPQYAQQPRPFQQRHPVPRPSSYQQLPLNNVRPVHQSQHIPVQPKPTAPNIYQQQTIQNTMGTHQPRPLKQIQPSPVLHLPRPEQQAPRRLAQTKLPSPTKSQQSKYSSEQTSKFETECLSESPSIPTLISLYTSGANPASSLHSTITSLNQPLFDFLMTLEIDMEWRDEDGNTAILVSSSCGTIEMNTAVLSRGVDIKARNKNGSNVVICATQNDNREQVLEMVIEAGGDVHVVNRYGTGVQRAIDELDVSVEEKQRLKRIVYRVDEDIMKINF